MFHKLSLCCAVLLSTATPCAAESGGSPCGFPEVNWDFPDPDALMTDHGYIVFASNSPAANVQVIRSRDLINWESLPDALPRLPSWAIPGHTWAPDVVQRVDGSYAMYFSARHRESDAQCVGVATSSSPAGPFSPVDSDSLVCPVEQGGAIDPATFTEADGERYLLWKTDGNCCGLDTWITIQRLSPDGLKLEGTPTRLIRQDQSWEGDVIEAPTLWQRRAATTCSTQPIGMTSTTRWDTRLQIRCWALTRNRRIHCFRRGGSYSLLAPGGQDVIDVGGGATMLFYHSWSEQNDYRGS
jgi:hypothetical protein